MKSLRGTLKDLRDTLGGNKLTFQTAIKAMLFGAALGASMSITQELISMLRKYLGY